MGGYGSTRWGQHTKRRTIEDGLTLPTRPIREVLRGGAASGSLTWHRGTGEERKERASIGYDFFPDPVPGVLRLRYERGKRDELEKRDELGKRGRAVEVIDYEVRLARTPLHFGGHRVWFVCPLLKNGRACGRRCGKLYLPPGARYFGCRNCHDLTYRSSQTAHEFDGLYRRLAIMMECSPEEVKAALER
ncbi:MAG: hypothetical protein AAGG50_03015 [Bacteroidota bacterium]